MKMSKLVLSMLVILNACTPTAKKESADSAQPEATQAGKVSVQIVSSTASGFVAGDVFTDLTVSTLSTGKYSFLRGNKVPDTIPTPTPSPTVTPTPTPTATPTPPVSVLPDKAKWESNMVVKGQQAWDQLKAAIAQWKATGDINQALAVTYYDMERVFYQVADYTKDPKWLLAAADAESVYRDGYVVRNSGGVPGYWNFSQGFLIDFQKNSDITSKDAILMLTQKGAYCPFGATSSAGRSREGAYCANAFNNAAISGSAPNLARRDTLVTEQVGPGGHIDQWINETYRAPNPFDVPNCVDLYYFQPFMGFLTMESLIRTYNLTHDPRILPKVKALADYTWTKAWVPADKAFWYENCWVPGQAIPAKSGAPDLNLLAVSVWGWLYQQTGDVKYREQGDQIWSGGVTKAYLENGKQFNQNYTFSFDYPKYRDAGLRKK